MTDLKPNKRPLGSLDLSLRDHVLPFDREGVRTLVTRTGFFSEAEIDVAVELVDERLFRGAASDYEFLFAQRGEHLVGYAAYGEIAVSKGSYDLYWIAVDPDEQGRGVGRFLLEETERRIREAGGRIVWVETSSRAQYAPTRSFYERSGYDIEAILYDFYAPGDHKCVYAKRVIPH